MKTIPSDWSSRFDAIVAARDPAAARDLHAKIQAAVDAGRATGFEPELAKLAEIAKAAPGRPETLSKRASVPRLPPHLEAEAEAVIARIEGATGRLEKAAAIEEGRRVRQRLNDFWAGEAIRAAQAAPRSMKGAWR